MSFRLSERMVLEKGDKVRVSGGPYYQSMAGNKISLGEKGLGTFVSAQEDGTAIHVIFNGENASKYVYIGPEKTSDSTGTIFKPHKIVKIRKKIDKK